MGTCGAIDTLQATQPALLAAVALLLLAAFVARERRALSAVGAFNAGQVLLATLYLQEGRGLSPVLTGLCFVSQAAGAFALSGPVGRLCARVRAAARAGRALGPGGDGPAGAGRGGGYLAEPRRDPEGEPGG